MEPVVSGTRWRPAARSGALLAACAAVAAFYAAPYAVRHLQVPLADDAFFYVAALRSVARLGLADPQVASRPAFPLVGSLLGALTGASPWVIAVASPVAMALGTGLAGAAIARRWVAGGGPWVAAFAALAATSAVTARLVAGKLENLMALWLLAALVGAFLWGRGRRTEAAIAALSLGVALTEWPLALAFAGVVGTAAAGAWILGRLGRPAGWNLCRDPRVLRASLAASAGLMVGLAAVFLIDRTAPANGIQNLPPGFRYSLRLRDELGLVWPVLTTVLAAIGWWVARARQSAAVEPARRLFSVWIVLTGLVLAVGLLGAPLPAYRAITFALPVALATAAAPFVMTGRPRLPRVAAAVIGVALGLLSLVPATGMWYRDLQPHTSPTEISVIAAAARYEASLPGRPQVVVVVNASRVVLAYLYQRVVADVVPPGQADRLLIFIGRRQDALAGRPTLGMGAQRDAVAEALFRQVGPALERGAPIVTGPALGAALFPRPLLVLRGPQPVASRLAGVTVVPIPRWWQVLAVALAALAFFAVAGAGWARLAMPASPPAVRTMLAPAFGAVASSVMAFVLVHAGVKPSGGGAALSLVLVAAASAAAFLAGVRGEAAPEV